jgi:DNA-binding NarL/FixJ family response regulator
VIRTLLVDDQALLRAGFRLILDREADIEVVGEADDGDTALELARQHAPDIVLPNARNPPPDLLGGETTRAKHTAAARTRDRSESTRRERIACGRS